MMSSVNEGSYMTFHLLNKGMRFVVVVVLLFYVHGKHLRSCRDGRASELNPLHALLINNMISKNKKNPK